MLTNSYLLGAEKFGRHKNTIGQRQYLGVVKDSVSLPEYISSKVHCDDATTSSLSLSAHTSLMISEIIVKTSIFLQNFKETGFASPKDAETVSQPDQAWTNNRWTLHLHADDRTPGVAVISHHHGQANLPDLPNYDLNKAKQHLLSHKIREMRLINWLLFCSVTRYDSCDAGQVIFH